MFTTDDRILVAVSGGKDSLALWDMLVDAEPADGLYIGLGIGDTAPKVLQSPVDLPRNAA